LRRGTADAKPGAGVDDEKAAVGVLDEAGRMKVGVVAGDEILGADAEAGPIALELGRMDERLDAIFVPLGNGSLINGIGTWFKQFSPATWVIGVCAEGAPAMELSWRAGKPVSTESAATIADGIGVRVPVPEALVAMRATVDEVMLVSDEEILEAMRMLLLETGLAVEPAGAAGLAAIAKRRSELVEQRVATPICGGNLTEDQIRRWLTSAGEAGLPRGTPTE